MTQCIETITPCFLIRIWGPDLPVHGTVKNVLAWFGFLADYPGVRKLEMLSHYNTTSGMIGLDAMLMSVQRTLLK